MEKRIIILFVNYILPPLILIIGLIGNSVGIKVLLNKNLINIGPRDMYQYLFLTDSFYLLQIIGTYLQYTYSLDITTISNVSCKVWYHLNYSLATISPWLVVFISIDRYISIKYPARRFIMRNRSNQFIWYLFVVISLQIYYLPVPFFYEIIELTNQTNINYCSFKNASSGLLISYMDLAIRVIVPFSLMLFMSMILSYSIFKSRKRIVENFLDEENKTFYKEIRLAVSSICLNLIYVFTQLPTSVYVFYLQDSNDFKYIFTLYLFYLSYAIDFYIILPTNSLFRKYFFALFNKKQEMIINY